MATLTTRTLDTKKERVIATLILALGIPCSAQLGVILGMLGSLSLTALLVTFGVVLSQVLLVGFLASKIIRGEPSDFIIEIPPVRIPKVSNVLIKTAARLEWFLKEAVPLFLLGTLILFIVDKIGLLKIAEKVCSPVITGLLSLPAEATWAFIIGFLRRDYGAAGLYQMQQAGLLTATQIVVSMVVITLFVPCLANFFVIIKEHGMKKALYMMGFIFPFAILVGGVLNFVLKMLNVQF
ncbi:MAG: ferrous iron transporter B [Candidatus Omnitrophica bacterium]|nr:ferrous iron transporter B [Candidatus Omnitrophota bacterium]